MLVLVIFVVNGAHAQGCIDYRDYLHWVGGVDTPGSAEDAAVAGNYACVADVGAGLQVVDISDPAVPRIVGSTTGASRAVAVAGVQACVADDAAGLQVVDISSPTGPVIVGGGHGHGKSYPVPFYCEEVAVKGEYVYVADVFGFFVYPAQRRSRADAHPGRLHGSPRYQQPDTLQDAPHGPVRPSLQSREDKGLRRHPTGSGP